MRPLALMVFLTVTVSLHSQRSDLYFSGAIELGIGWGHVIDFSLNNNNFSSQMLFQRLFALPWQLGVYVTRSLYTTSYLEYGMLYHRRSSDWIYSRDIYHGFGSSSHPTTHEVLAFDCIDFSLKYYKFLSYWKGRSLYVYGGLSPVWVLNVIYGSDLVNNSVPDNCFRDWNLALTGGLALERGKLRWRFNFDLCLVPVFNSEYRNIVPEEERAWGAYAFPFEALVCCAYIIR